MAVRVGLAETVFVPVVIDKAFVLVVGVAVESAAAVFHLFVDLLVRAVENRAFVCAEELVINRVLTAAVFVQQVADFSAGELLGGFGSCFVETIGLAVGEVVAVFNCAIIILNHTIHITACKRSGTVAIFNCTARTIPGDYSSASTIISCNISSVIAIYN